MMNREVVGTEVVKPKDALKLRQIDRIEIKMAWTNGAMIPVEHGTKRRNETAGERPKRQQKSG